MTADDLLSHDVDSLRHALDGDDQEIEVALTFPRDVAVRVLALLDAERKGGAIVVPSKTEFTTSEAATILSVSRPHLIKLLDAGELEHRMVGSHRRIPARAVVAFKEQDLARRRAAMDELAALSNELGLVE